MASLIVKRRALSLVTRGLLAGSAIALATRGLIQLPEPPAIELPVIVAPAAGGAAGYVQYLAVPQNWKHLSEARFILDADSLAELSHHQPLEIKKLEPTKLHAVYNAEGVLHILSESEWKHWEDDSDLIVLLAMKLLG